MGRLWVYGVNHRIPRNNGRIEMDKTLLSQALELTPPQKEIFPRKETPEVDSSFDKKDIETDYDKLRKTLHSIITEGNEAIKEAKDIASRSEIPESYTALASLIKAVSAATKELYDVHKRTKELNETSKDKKIREGDVTVEKAIFVGTPSELLKQIKSENE